MSKSLRKDIINATLAKIQEGRRVIPYNAYLARLLGSITAALFLHQCVYWTTRTPHKNGWFYKTVNYMKLETGLSKYQQLRAIKILKDWDLIEIKLHGIPATRWFRVKIDNLIKFLESNITESDESSQEDT